MRERLAAVTIHVVRDGHGSPWLATTNEEVAKQLASEFKDLKVEEHRLVLRVGETVAIHAADLNEDEEEGVSSEVAETESRSEET